MAELGPKNKHKVSAKSLANLRPNPQNMRHRGGSKAREYVTNQELEVLNNLLDGSNYRDAARRVIVVVLIFPLIAMALLWTVEKRLGLILMSLSMFGSLPFGLYHHFLAVSPDHVH